jgi:hypothetical protein
MRPDKTICNGIHAEPRPADGLYFQPSGSDGWATIKHGAFGDFRVEVNTVGDDGTVCFNSGHITRDELLGLGRRCIELANGKLQVGE